MPSGDITYNHYMNLKNKLCEPHELEVCSTDFGEIFYFNFKEFDNGECPVYLRLPSGESVLYAHDFYEFLYKRINECLEE